MSKMKRIMVIGCPGSGKSTFSRALNKKTGLPLYYLDMLYWQEDGTIIDRSVFLERLNEVIKKDEWIIDGNYGSTIEMRLKACDTVIFLDYPLEVCLKGVEDRVGKYREDMPWVEKEIDMEFVEFIKNFRSHSRPTIIDLLNKYSVKQIFVFKSRSEADEFLKGNDISD